MATFTNQNKSATPTWNNTIKHGRATLLRDIKDNVFTDAPFGDGVELKDKTFLELQEQSWTNTNKSATPTWTNETRN